MALMLKKIFRHTPLALLLLTGVSATAVGAGFYTIIGPDGRPMVVPERTSKKKSDVPQAKIPPGQVISEKIQNAKVKLKDVHQVQRNISNLPQKAQSVVEQTQNIDKSASTQQQALNKENSAKKVDQVAVAKVAVVPTTQKAEVFEKVDATRKEPQPIVTEKINIPISVNHSDQPSTTSSTQVIHSDVKQKSLLVNKQAETQFTQTQQALKVDEKMQSQDDQKPNNFVEIDGVQYVNNEYLEEREFNLEGKKRFYIMPEAGSSGAGHHVETVEREKGLGHSLIEKIQKQKPEIAKTIALSPTYYRLPKTEVVESLQKACFTDKKVTKAKILDLKNKDVGFWPVAPIKDDFAYEVVKLDQQVENVLLTSYASSQKSPSYYWPLVVFLDQKGCVVEGVSGFKNQNLDENNMQHAAMEGILKKPETASYMFMTPLSAAVDAENMQLTNQGQIKLSVIR